MNISSLRFQAAVAALGVSLGLSPVAMDIPNATFGVSSAQAKGGEGGGGGGSDRGGRDNDRSADRGDKGNGNSGNAREASARGQERAAERAVERATAEAVSAAGVSKGRAERVSLDAAVSASSLGRLNAAHASPTARANAAANSTVGQIAAYEQAALVGDVQAAAESLAMAANKTVDTSVVKAVNELLSLETPAGFDASVAAGANNIQRDESLSR